MLGKLPVRCAMSTGLTEEDPRNRPVQLEGASGDGEEEMSELEKEEARGAGWVGSVFATGLSSVVYFCRSCSPK